METSIQAWKFAKGLYLIPLFMVFNEPIIVGGPLPLVLWNGLIAIIALVAFAAALEGFLFGADPAVAACAHHPGRDRDLLAVARSGSRRRRPDCRASGDELVQRQEAGGGGVNVQAPGPESA